MTAPFEIRQSRAVAASVVIFIAAMAALSTWMTGEPGTRNMVIGWAGLAFLGALAPGWVGALVRPGLLRADGHGIVLRTVFRERFWRWSDIEAVGADRPQRAGQVVLLLREPVRLEGVLGSILPIRSRFRRLPPAWKLKPEAIVARLSAMKAQNTDASPSRPANPIVM